MAEINIEKMARNVAEKAMQELMDNGVFIGRWIPVTEEMPKVADCYLVTRQIGDDLMVDACYFDGIHTWHNDTWINRERNYLTDVIAWMPMPEEYKPEGYEGE